MDNGGPAFPHPVLDMAAGDGFGMSLRDYLAAKAMAALIIASGQAGYHSPGVAQMVYNTADAMLKERAKC